MQATVYSQYGWSENITAKSLRGLKQKASRDLSYGCGNLTLETEDAIYVRRFWRRLNKFG